MLGVTIYSKVSFEQVFKILKSGKKHSKNTQIRFLSTSNTQIFSQKYSNRICAVEYSIRTKFIIGSFKELLIFFIPASFFKEHLF